MLAWQAAASRWIADPPGGNRFPYALRHRFANCCTRGLARLPPFRRTAPSRHRPRNCPGRPQGTCNIRRVIGPSVGTRAVRRPRKSRPQWRYRSTRAQNAKRARAICAPDLRCGSPEVGPSDSTVSSARAWPGCQQGRGWATTIAPLLLPTASVFRELMDESRAWLGQLSVRRQVGSRRNHCRSLRYPAPCLHGCGCPHC